ncbi:hypothetical protein CKY28_07070 [Sphingomonas lenta]|uniref:Uncharacterized protein n=2 Tax=Sphingomonas lenta TaxID=1141887 RepID=A0A2A2SIU5_9SPHN|nr:hypothetical protein CKY28_07070 [Sphingomonas lenta]
MGLGMTFMLLAWLKEEREHLLRRLEEVEQELDRLDGTPATEAGMVTASTAAAQLSASNIRH